MPDVAMPAVNPDWRRKPSGEEMAQAYPPAAIERELSGRATIRCQVRLDGTVGDCVVVSEEPAGLGFGKAALEISQYFEMYPGIRDGVPQESTVRIPIAFQLPETVEAPQPPSPLGVSGGLPPIDPRAPAIALGIAVAACLLLLGLYVKL